MTYFKFLHPKLWKKAMYFKFLHTWLWKNNDLFQISTWMYFKFL